MAKLVHSMIRVANLEASVEFYKQAFDLEVVDRVEFDSFALVYLRNAESDFEIELMWNRGGTDPHEMSAGHGHLAVSVPHAESERTRLESEGLRPGPLKQMDYDGELLGRYFFVSDPDGHPIEVLEQAGRFV
ncbi:MAG: lactoylglutathione lyase [Acidobacteria bacterium]|nr:lactoylglutathione lyase [Acidobacteriota bacterium]